MAQLFIGIDLGTSGIRTLISDERGQVLGKASAPVNSSTANGIHEQNPPAWWDAVQTTVRSALHEIGSLTSQLAGIAVDGTSGTLVCADSDGKPLGPAIMYNDTRGTHEAESLRRAGRSRVSSSWALPKAVWVKHHDSGRFAAAERLLHQADWIAGQLCGSFEFTDYSNALKMGVDLDTETWPDWIDVDVHERLPKVVAPGTRIGEVTRAASEATGLPQGIPVLAGATDGVAACLASGLGRVGDYNTTLGTTLIFKGLAKTRPPNPLIYSHKLPGPVWLPGAASNTGGAWIAAWFPEVDPNIMDAAAARLLPTYHAAYPLTRQGERFPFVSQEAVALINPDIAGAERYAACLQGTACLERLAYEVLDAATGASGGAVYSTGGGSRSDVWMQCRADICQRVIHRPACTDTAMGAAILAAAGTHYPTIQEATRRMTQVTRTFHPQSKMDGAYDQFLTLICPYLEADV